VKEDDGKEEDDTLDAVEVLNPPNPEAVKTNPWEPLNRRVLCQISDTEKTDACCTKKGSNKNEVSCIEKLAPPKKEISHIEKQAPVKKEVCCTDKTRATQGTTHTSILVARSSTLGSATETYP